MAGEDQERFEDYLELEHFIEELQAGRVAHPPKELTSEQARIYAMATLFHAASSEEATPRPEFATGLQAKLEQELQPRTKPFPFTPKKPQKRLHVTRRSLLVRGAATAVAAATVAMGVGIDHAIEEERLQQAVATAQTAPSWDTPLVPTDIATTWHYVANLSEIGDQAFPFNAGAITGYVIRNDGDSGIPLTEQVIAISAACTHMGCIVQWNNTDRKYHCPCHGGLFSTYGQVDVGSAPIRYLAALPRLDAHVDPAGKISVRVPVTKKPQ